MNSSTLNLGYFVDSFVVTRERKRYNDFFSYHFVNILSTIYLFIALRYIKKIQNNILKDLLNKPETFSKRELTKLHNRNKSILDTTDLSRLHFIEKSWYQSALIARLIKLINVTKEIEMHSRALLYPERNEILLTYDQLKELISLTQDFECASEQSNAYQSH